MPAYSKIFSARGPMRNRGDIDARIGGERSPRRPAPAPSANRRNRRPSRATKIHSAQAKMSRSPDHRVVVDVIDLDIKRSNQMLGMKPDIRVERPVLQRKRNARPARSLAAQLAKGAFISEYHHRRRERAALPRFRPQHRQSELLVRKTVLAPVPLFRPGTRLRAVGGAARDGRCPLFSRRSYSGFVSAKRSM